MRSDFVGLAGWTKNSFIDYPGTVSTVLFFSGCNCRCPYCHNPSLLNASAQMERRSDEIWTFLEKRRGLVEGVVLTGGEPTLHPALVDAIEDVRNLGYRVKLDSNGMLPEMIETFAPDYLALDVKTDPGLYQPVLKASYADAPERLMRSIALARNMGARAEIRITAAPGLIDTNIISRLGVCLEGIEKVYLQPMNRHAELLDSAFADREPISSDRLEEFRDYLMKYVKFCTVRGG